MRKLVLALGFSAVALVVAAFAVAASSKNDDLLPNEQHFVDSKSSNTSKGTKGGSAWNMVAVGQNDLAGRASTGTFSSTTAWRTSGAGASSIRRTRACVRKTVASPWWTSTTRAIPCRSPI